MRARLLENYEFKRNRTDPSPHLNRLGEFFGTMHGEEITEERIAEYSRKRLKSDRVAPATLRRELAVLKRRTLLRSSRITGGGAIVTWRDYRNGTNDDIYAQRVAPDGSLGGTVVDVSRGSLGMSVDFSVVWSDPRS